MFGSPLLDETARRLAGEFPRRPFDGNRLLTRLTSDEIRAGLRAIRAMRHLIAVHEERLIRLGRAEGWSWAHIAMDLGVSRQAVSKRWGPRLKVPLGRADYH